MDQWTRLASAIYYSGVGAVLLGTTLRYIYRLFKKQDEDHEFLQEMQEVHLDNIYHALFQIAKQLKIDLELKKPSGIKPLLKDSWTPLD